MQVQAMLAGQKRENLVQILPQLRQRARLAGIVARGLDAAASEARFGIFKTADIVALPAMERKGDLRQPVQGRFRIDTMRGVGFPGPMNRRMSS